MLNHLILVTLLIIALCVGLEAAESVSIIPQSVTAQGDTDPFSTLGSAAGKITTKEITNDLPADGKFYNFSIVSGGSGYPGMNVVFDSPVDFSNHDVLKVWVRADYPTFYLEIVINGADGVIQDINLAGPASRGYGKMQANQWYVAYIPYKADPGWVRFGKEMDHTAIKSITFYTFSEYLKTTRASYGYDVGGMLLMTTAEAKAEIASGAGRKVPITGKTLISAKGLTLWTSAAEEKVYKETATPVSKASTINAAGAGGEYVPIICHLNSETADIITSVAVEDLVYLGNKIPSTAAECRYVDNVDGTLETFPDPMPLAAGKRIIIAPKTNRTIWTTWRIPEGTKPGTYKGRIKIALASGNELDVPISLKVYGFDIPQKNHLKMVYWIHHFYGGVPYFVERSKQYWGQEIQRSSPEYVECVNNVIASYGEHRITPELDRVEFQYLTFEDREKLIAKYHFDPGFVLYHNFINEFLAMDPITPEKVDRVNAAIRKSADRLIEAGYKDLCCIKVADEPNEESMKLTIFTAEQIRKTIPEVQCFYAGASDKIPEGLVGKLDTYCMSWGLFDFTGKQAKERLSAGEKLWAYAADYQANSAYDPLTLRQNYWLYWKYGITGVHYAHHVHANFFTYPNDTYMHSDGLKEIPSVRFEMLRLGIQDYEYLWMLDDLIKQTGSTDPKILELLKVPDELAKNEWEMAADPRVMQSRRQSIAAAIQELSAKLK